MNCKNRSHECAAPKSGNPASIARHLLEQKKKQNRGRAVQQNIHKMMRTGLQSEKLAIEHMGHCREGVPVLGMNMRERPSNAVPV